MSDTVAIALITFATAVLSAGIGAFATWKTAKLSAAKELAYRIREEKKLCFSQLVTAYHALLSKAALNDECRPPSSGQKGGFDLEEIDLLTQFQAVYSNAILICSQSTIDVLTKLIQQSAKMLETRNYSQLNAAYISAINAMRKELGTLENQFPNGGDPEQVQNHQTQDN